MGRKTLGKALTKQKKPYSRIKIAKIIVLQNAFSSCIIYLQSIKNEEVFFMSEIKKKKITIPTYKVGEPEALPLYFEKRPYQGASGRIYPIPYVSSFSDDKTDCDYDGYVLENEYIRAVLLPELGGKVHCALDKTNGYDFIYNNKVIKPAMVGLAGPWVSGGIEFNWPQHHRPTTFMPVEHAEGKSDGKKAVFMGEVDYFHQMKGHVALSIDEGTSVLRAKITVYNQTPVAHPFMWWANLAVEIDDDYRTVFPPDVEYVNDHDRRAVLEWPVAKGVYHTARPYDYGKGTDIHVFSAIKVPSSFMISKGQSEMDFVCGYDKNKESGVVTVANHHIAPGKKLWTWGDGKFGAKWCENLTDDGSRYVELMTGCYTDNQPDFTWIAPYETKEFEQVWYPVRDIGEVKCATEEGACNLEKTEKGAFVGFYSVKKRNCVITLVKGDNVIFETKAEVSPAAPFVTTVDYGGEIKDLTLKICDESGKLIVAYKQPVRGNKKPISPRLPAKKPCDIDSVEELYLNGIHLRQYKHFEYCPEDYFLEALKRDPKDIRCNKAMGDKCLERGEYDKAESYYNAAIERLTLRNDNPYDTEPYYKRALCKFYKGDLTGAYNDAYLAVWSYPERSAGYYLLAKIAAQNGNKQEAVSFLKLSLETQSKNLWAKYVLGIFEGDKDINAKIEEIDPLFFSGFEKEKNAVNYAIEAMQFGLYDLAEKALEKCADRAIKFYYLAYLAQKRGDKAASEKYVKLADGCSWKCEFPVRTETVPVLKAANTAMAHYYLGCIYYAYERYEEAVDMWKKTTEEIDFAPAYRNMALGLYDHLNKPVKARAALEKAHVLMPESNRIFFELTQLYKGLNLPLEKRLALYKNEEETVFSRDDCTLQYSVLSTLAGETDKAFEILANHRFHTYEGGEGYLTQHHAWLHFLTGRKLLAEKEYKKAEEMLISGLTFPLNYGEEKNYFVNDAPIYLELAKVYEAQGLNDKRDEYLNLALTTHGAPTIHSYYECLAFNALGKTAEAKALAAEMDEIGKTKIETAEIPEYYGVGSPAYQPFNYDIEKIHLLAGYLMRGFASLAKGDKKAAGEYAEKAEKIDSADFSLYLLKGEING